MGNWNIDAIREKNTELNELREWISLSDFNFSYRHAEYFKYNKDQHLILEIQDAFGNFMKIREGRLQNYWGRIGISLLGLISKIYNELSENFEVTLKGSLKFYTDDLTENEKLLIDNSKHNHLCVYGFHIEESNNSLGADFLFDQRDYI